MGMGMGTMATIMFLIVHSSTAMMGFLITIVAKHTDPMTMDAGMDRLPSRLSEFRPSCWRWAMVPTRRIWTSPRKNTMDHKNNPRFIWVD